MSWDTVGSHVELSIDYSTEYRRALVGLSWTKQERLITTERAEWRGLTKAGAAAKSPSSGYDIVSRELRGPAGQWFVVEEKVTEGSWS